MKFIIKQIYFIDALRILSGTTEKSANNNFSANVFFNLTNKHLLMKTCDGEIELTIKIVNINIIKIGTLSTNFDKLYNICKNFDKQELLTIELKIQNVYIKTINSEYMLSTFNSSLFPVYKKEILDIKFTIGRIFLKNMINKISFSMSSQDIRSFLNGMLFDFNEKKLTLVSTDGYRLSKVDFDININHEINKKIILPRKSVIEMHKILSLCKDEQAIFFFSMNYIEIIIDNVKFRTKLLAGIYPNYNNFIPKNNNKFLVINNIKLRKTIMRMSVLCNIKSNKILFTCSKNILKLKTLNFHQDKGKEKLDIDYLGNEIKICFNIKYFIDILYKIESSLLEISFYDGISSAVLKEVQKEKYNLIYIIMPVKI